MTTITLSKPVEYNGTTYTEVTVRAPVLADMLKADVVQGEATKQAAIYASITGVPFPAFTQLSPGDYIEIMTAADALAGNDQAPAIGDTSAA